MKRFRKVLEIVNVVIIILTLVTLSNIKRVNAQINFSRQKPIIIDVVLYNAEDKFISLVRQNFEEIQKQNEGRVIFRFFDGKGNQAIQNEVLSSLIRDNADILLVNLIDTKATKDVLDMFRQRNMPIIFFNREPVDISAIKTYSKSYYVGTDAREAGRLQAQLLINLWNNDKNSIDKNKNDVLQYVIFEGERSNIEAQNRTESVISTLENSGIRTKRIAESVVNWDRELARESMNSLFLSYDTKIEAIIANNDEMAIGAIEALQKYGYNLGDKNKTIPVVGIDATAEARELINKGFMAGSVVQDPAEMAKAAYTVGLNVFEGNEPLADTPYKFDDTKVVVRLPYTEYTNLK